MVVQDLLTSSKELKFGQITCKAWIARKAGKDEHEGRKEGSGRLRRGALPCPRSSLLTSFPPLPTALDALCQGLQHAFQDERQHLGGATIDYDQPPDSFARLHANVRLLLAAYAANAAQDWRSFMAFNPHHYVRHLMDTTEDYELILICWRSGQVSSVHNHGTSHCWFTCLEGEVEEKQYQEALVCQAECGVQVQVSAPCPRLVPITSSTHTAGCTGYINDHMYLHSIGCGKDVPDPGTVTLHLYAPPIRRVRLYEPDEDRVTTRVPGFFTVRGKPT